jgi:hypothetical protein
MKPLHQLKKFRDWGVQQDFAFEQVKKDIQNYTFKRFVEEKDELIAYTDPPRHALARGFIVSGEGHAPSPFRLCPFCSL